MTRRGKAVNGQGSDGVVMMDQVTRSLEALWGAISLSARISPARPC